MDKVWIVMGSTGEYSDRREWIVEARASKEAAEARVKRLGDLLQESGIERMDRWKGDWEAAREAFRANPEGDPRFDIDYTGTTWWVEECPVRYDAISPTK